jgi:hypothetical protein
MLESFDPIYDTTANTLAYTITAENVTIDLPGEFGQSVLVIDGFKVGHYPFQFPQQDL